MTLFKDEAEASQHIHNQVVGTDLENISFSKPYLAHVTVKKPHTLFKVLQQDDTRNALAITSSQEIKDKLTFGS